MEILFRKYFWAVNLLFILLAAWIAASTVNVFVETAIRPAPVPGTRAPRRLAPVETQVSTLDLETLARLTGLKVPDEPTVVEPGSGESVDPNAAPVRSGLSVKLLGTLVAGDPKWSFASIQNMGNQKSTTYMVGDRVEGAEVLEIERARVIVANNGRREFIDGSAGEGAPAYTPPTPVAAAPGKQSFGNGIKSTGDNEYEVPRAEIDRTLSNLNDVAMQARIVPAFKDGQAQGFKLFSIRPDSIYSKIGVQNGDVIKRINGFDMNSPEKALEVYSKLKESSRIEIDIERNGAPVKKTYNVR